MSSDAETFIRMGLSQGFELETLLDAATSLRGEAAAQTNGAPSPVESVKETAGWWANRPVDDAERTFIFPPSPAASTDPLRIEGLARYDDLGVIGKGGMGVVHRVFDRLLQRTLALKVTHRSETKQPELVARFLEEAQTTAQLQHPGIIPIHDMGSLPDGRVWFTMKEVEGRTLGKVIAEVHTVSRKRWMTSASGWSLRRLVEVLLQVCEAVGYAHSRGVVHRDLKPSNIMVGGHGEVLVLDWGLVKILGRAEHIAGRARGTPVLTNRSRDGVHHTQVGIVAGTPAYMPPEQAMGRVDQIGAHSDVYALGALLYKMLSGCSPYSGKDSSDVLEKVRNGPPTSLRTIFQQEAPGGQEDRTTPDVRAALDLQLPAALVEACEQAMARSPEDRFASAAELGAELQAWLDGSKRRDEGRLVVVRATRKEPEAFALRQRAAALRTEAAALLAGMEPWRPEVDKHPGWQKEDEAAALDRQADRLVLEAEQLLQGALTHAPELPEAHAALAARYRALHGAAEASCQDTTRAETLLRHHVSVLPDDHPDRTEHLMWLKGDGAITLVTDPPGAEVLLHRYVVRHRRLVPRFERSLGQTPLREVSVPMGSYLCVLRHPDRAEVRYPVCIGRGEHWHGVPPNGGEAFAVPLPWRGELGPDDCYVPAGWFQCGGDPHQERSLSARRIWVDGQVVRRFPVTNESYIAFLHDLVAAGRTDEALRHAARERAGTAGDQGALIYGFNGQRFSLRADADGDLWEPAWPVCMVDWHGAQAFAAWEASRTGDAWRLTGDLAWEKAARGVDGRFYPWGNGFDPSWVSMRLSHRGPMNPTPVGAFPIDESPYGVRDLAGSMQDWCEDHFVEDPAPQSSARSATDPPMHQVQVASVPALDSDGDATALPSRRAIRGGSWYFVASILRSSLRNGVVPTYRHGSLGFRLARAFRPG